MEINFTKKSVTVVKAVTATIEKVTLIDFTDDGKSVKARTVIEGFPPQLVTLWEGEEYTNAGQYTDTDIKNRIIEKL